MPNYPFTIKYSLLSLILLLPHRKILIDSGSFVRRAPRVNATHIRYLQLEKHFHCSFHR